MAAAWADDQWGVAWAHSNPTNTLRFRTLKPDGLVVGPVQEPVEVEVKWPYRPALAWANDRFAVSYLSTYEPLTNAPGVYTAILNKHGYAPWGGFRTELPRGVHGSPSIARYTSETLWLVAAAGANPEGGEYPVVIAAVDDTGAPTGDGPINAGTTLGDVTLVGLKSRALVLWIAADGCRTRSFSWPYTTTTAGPELLAVPSDALTESSHASALALRDTVIAAVVAEDRLLAFSVDPWSDQVLSGPHEIATVGAVDATFALGGAEQPGYAGICYVRREESDASLFFRLIGPDGRPWSPEHVITTGNRLIEGCAVAFNGTLWAVSWWALGNAPDYSGQVNAQLFRPEDG